jgi:hypothetical protein
MTNLWPDITEYDLLMMCLFSSVCRYEEFFSLMKNVI